MNIKREVKKAYNYGLFCFAQSFLSKFLFGRFLNINNLNKNMAVLFDVTP